MNKKGQTWSFDLIVAVAIFILVIGLFYGYLAKDRSENNDLFLEDGKLLAYMSNCDNKDGSELCFMSKGEADNVKLDEFYNYTYEYVKEEFGVNKDFCIYVVDSKGNLFPIDDKTGVGSSDLILTESGLLCGTILEDGGIGSIEYEID